jgi:hypothetical protein
MSNRYMRKPYRCNICFRSFDTEKQAEKHWFSMHEDGTLNKRCPTCGIEHRNQNYYCSPTCRDIALGSINPALLPSGGGTPR